MDDRLNFPTSSGDLIFPSASRAISTALSGLRRSALSPHNRLRSILRDSTFVQEVADTYNLPLIANERCGRWYIPPSLKAGSVYFKSTDGHTGQWAFSTRRLNLHLLDIVGEHGGCIIVDSTRRGKAMPDALSKTIPIWCAVINRLLFGWGDLHLPQAFLRSSEGAQISEKLDAWVGDIKKLRLDMDKLRKKLSKPLRPVWMTPETLHSPPSYNFKSCHPVICCTASKRVRDSETTDDGYVQGAADDSESWAHGITPELFWEYKDTLLSTREEDLASMVNSLSKESKSCSVSPATRVNPTGSVYIGNLASVDATSFDRIIVCSSDPARKPEATKADEAGAQDTQRGKVLELNCGSGKLGSRALRTLLPRVAPCITSITTRSNNPRLLFACETGKDLSAGVALAVLCMYYDDAGNFQPDVSNAHSTPMSKDLIRRRLAWITTSEPSINPSGATLQTVNAFLMPKP